MPKYVAVKDDFLSKPLDSPEKVNLMGSRCRKCGEVFMGKAIACQRCQSDDLESIPLSRKGTLYSYTVNWNKPPGDYKGPEPFQPFGVGLVELPEGIRVLSVLSECKLDKLKVGMPMELAIKELYKDAEGNTVLTFTYRPQEAERRQ